MLFWLIIGLAILLVFSVVLRAMTGMRENGLDAAASDVAVYRDQLREIERDRERGVLPEVEAEAARTEVARRLLAADTRQRAGATARSGGRGVALALVGVVLLFTVGLYTQIGAPLYSDQPIAVRLAELDARAAERMDQATAEEAARASLPLPPLPEPEFVELVERLRAAIAERPDDPQGLALLARNEARLGNMTAARDAQFRLVKAKGADATVEDRLRLLDIMIYAAGGYISPEAEEALNRLLSVAPNNPAARYYQGLLFVQTGRYDRAFPIWRALLEQSPPDAPWVPSIRAGIADVAAGAGVQYEPPASPRGPTAADVEAASEMTAEDRGKMIRGMVSGLENRLATEGGPPEDWARLITALSVLGETDRARAIADEARTVFAGNADAASIIEQARQSAGIDE